MQTVSQVKAMLCSQEKHEDVAGTCVSAGQNVDVPDSPKRACVPESPQAQRTGQIDGQLPCSAVGYPSGCETPSQRGCRVREPVLHARDMYIVRGRTVRLRAAGLPV